MPPDGKRGPILGLVLAGGAARRLGGGDKPLRPLGAGTILDHAIACLRPQVAALALSANGDPARFARFGVAVLPDPLGGFPGPLAGLLAGLDWAHAVAGEGARLVSLPGDTPFAPPDLVARLCAAGGAVAVAASGGRRHCAIGLWPVAARHTLRTALVEEGLRKVETFADRLGAVLVSWPVMGHDPFFNINTPEDLAAAEAIAARLRRS